ncbi:MAG: apolipoprotein N-acyltransferase [Candidatus Bipolaricaulota bacterium]|nr:apolipoprotein N-acyltransferase [Candidatus Bipolaricaulota bacterium]
MFRASLAILAALLALLSMPGYLVGGLIFVALVPLFYALEGCSPRQGFLIGYLCGFVFFALLLYWLYALFEWAGIFIVFGHIGLAGLLALWWGLWGASFSVIQGRFPRAQGLALPAMWVLLEYLRSLTKFGFTWGFLSDALWQHPQLIQIASVTGTWGISFLIVLVNFLLYRALRERRLIWGIIALSVIALAWGWGVYQLSVPVPQGAPLRVAIIHSNVAQRARSDPAQLPSIQNLYLSQVERLQAGEVDLVLLPESLVPAYLLRQRELLAPYQEQARRLGAALIVGTIDYRDGKLFNTAALLAPDGEIADLYDKVQLVPFSTEYFPLIGFLRNIGLENLIGPLPLGALTPGEGFRPLASPSAPLPSAGEGSKGVRGQRELGEFKIATPICFESIFSHISRAFVRSGAQALLVITNDAWFKSSKALEQHFAKAVFRAVETGRYTIQASNGGISGVIDPAGRILSSTRSEKEQILQEKILLQDHATLYVQLGDWVVYLLGVVLAGVIFVPVLVSLVTAPVERFTL